MKADETAMARSLQARPHRSSVAGGGEITPNEAAPLSTLVGNVAQAGAVALAECFTGCWGDVFGRGVWLGVGTFLVLEPAVFVEPMLSAIVMSPGPRHTTAAAAPAPAPAPAKVPEKTPGYDKLSFAEKFRSARRANEKPAAGR
jgi:hypothetical protein